MEPVETLVTRLREIKQRAEDGDYHCREHWGMFDADGDVLFLCAQILALQQQLAEKEALVQACQADNDLLNRVQDAGMTIREGFQRAEAAQAEVLALQQQLDVARRERDAAHAHACENSLEERQLRATVIALREALRLADAHIRDVLKGQPFPDDSGWRVYAEPLLQHVLREFAGALAAPEEPL